MPYGAGIDRSRSAHLVHIVAAEGEKDLIGPQVVDPMQLQAEALGTDGPADATAVLLEPGRKFLRPPFRAHLRSLRARAAPARVFAYPLVGRMGVRYNAALLARWLQFAVGRRRILFHCRGENAVEWAAAIAPYFKERGIVADIRGAWPEEALHAAGFDGPDGAPPPLVRRYHVHLSRLQAALACAGAILSVSPGMLDWLSSLGVSRDRMAYVPCAVPGPRFDDSVRRAMRRQLGLDGKLVYAYVGILASYHSIEDGLVRFFRTISAHGTDAHLLCITTEPDRLKRLLTDAGVPPNRMTVMRAEQPSVPALLSAADCGLLLMRRCRLASTWQPIKFAEYLASGLPVVVSPGVGVLDREVAREGVGTVIDVFGDGDLEASANRTHSILREHGCEMRKRALALCERDFVWRKYVPTWRRAYQRAFEWEAVPGTVSSVGFGL